MENKKFIISKSRYIKGSYTFLDMISKEEYRQYSSKESAKKDINIFIKNKEWKKHK